MKYVVGLNAYHGDSSACLLADGELIAAAEEERFRRIKHWAGFPAEALRYCLDEAGIGIDRVDHLAINSDPGASLWRKAGYALLRRPTPALVLEKLRTRKRRGTVDEHLAQVFPGAGFRGRIHRVEHHLAHLASCFHVSPFEEAVAVSVDGFGDFASAAWGAGRGRRLGVDGRVYFPHSLGVFYQGLTQYLGFPNYGDEYKVMGLAPYGEPRFMEAMRRIVRLCRNGEFRLNLRYFRHHRHEIGYEWKDAAPQVSRLYSEELVRLLGPARAAQEPLVQRHRDIARSVQAMYEEAFFHLLNRLHARYGLEALALAGGCAMNSVANGRIYRNTPFERVYVQSAAGDAGGAIGSAIAAWGRISGRGRDFRMEHAYWGPSFGPDEIGSELGNVLRELAESGCSVEEVADEAQLCERTARLVADGGVVGWFQGRMEWGPRALGNRSIVCDPRRADMKDILNRKIKRRESFRPFAPSVLREAVGEWFESDDDVPFMMKVFQIREDKRERIPAVTHVDGSGRLQTVRREDNPRYYRLIEAFRDFTGVPMVLNTSFNENEPVVCRPREAINCFLRTRMDVLVLDRFIVRRQALETQ